jgi:hypothetical protein
MRKEQRGVYEFRVFPVGALMWGGSGSMSNNFSKQHGLLSSCSLHNIELIKKS